MVLRCIEAEELGQPRHIELDDEVGELEQNNWEEENSLLLQYILLLPLPSILLPCPWYISSCSLWNIAFLTGFHIAPLGL